MPDVSVYVAVVTAAAAVAAAAVSQIPVYVRDVRQAGQDRRERHAKIRREACLDLLGAAEDLRTSVANAVDYHGEEMSARLADIRNVAAAVQGHAAKIELLVPGTLAGTAERLASVAGQFAATAVANTDLDLGHMVVTDPAGLAEAIEVFRKQAVLEAAR
jgi:hypothetical protein